MGQNCKCKNNTQGQKYHVYSDFCHVDILWTDYNEVLKQFLVFAYS